MIVWIDLETTGLSKKCAIIEIAVILTDEKYNEIARYESLVTPIAGARREKGAMEMHMASGLWKEVSKNGTKQIDQVDREVANLIKKNLPSGSRPPILAGSSVHFDRGFIEEWMPKTNKSLYYRNLDVSSIKVFAANGLGIPTDSLPPKKSTRKHRAINDILDSIAAIKWFGSRFGLTTINGYKEGWWNYEQ